MKGEFEGNMMAGMGAQPPPIDSVADAFVQNPHAALPVVVAFGAMVSLINSFPSTERFRPSCPTTCASGTSKPRGLPKVRAIVKRPARQSALEALSLQVPALQTAGGIGRMGERLKVVPGAKHVP